MKPKIFQLLVAILLSFTVSGQSNKTPIETAVDDAEFQRIIEYYIYDKDIPSDPRFYGEWPWRGPHTLYKLSYRSVREQRVPAYLAISKDEKEEKLPVVVLMHGWNLLRKQPWSVLLQGLDVPIGHGYKAWH
ncbi:MAG: hypothetical protein V2B15_07455 [Bacteroidota bacterium]